MTLGEIYSVLWSVRDENSQGEQDPDIMDDLYQDLMAAKEAQKQNVE